MYSNKLVCDIINYLDINLNKKVSINELENVFFYNRYYIMKLFKKEMNIKIVDYINALRIYNSMNDLKDYNYSLTSTFINNGFYSLEYFSETFKKIVGVSPSIYKKFCKNRNSVSEKDYNKIINSSLILQELLDKKNRYLNNLKPVSNPVKTLTIFK